MCLLDMKHRKKAFDSLLQALGQEVNDPDLQLSAVPEGFQEPCWKIRIPYNV